MNHSFKRKADNLKIEPSQDTWTKINSRLQYIQMEKERNRYRRSLSIVASVAILSILFNTLYISEFFNIDINETYMASSSLKGIESGEPFHMATDSLNIKDNEISPVRRIEVKKH